MGGFPTIITDEFLAIQKHFYCTPFPSESKLVFPRKPPAIMAFQFPFSCLFAFQSCYHSRPIFSACIFLLIVVCVPSILSSLLTHLTRFPDSDLSNMDHNIQPLLPS